MVTLYKDKAGNYLIQKYIKSRNAEQVIGYNKQGKVLNTKGVTTLMKRAGMKIQTSVPKYAGIHKNIAISMPSRGLFTDKFSRNLSMAEFIKLHKIEIDEAIHSAVPNAKINDEERRLWILNSEGLYNWARKSGVRL